MSILAAKIKNMENKQIKNVCESIKKIRNMKGFTQQNMADELGMTQRHYGRIENGEVDITLSQLYKICEVLNVDVSVVLNLREPLIMNNINHQENKKSNLYFSTDIKNIQELYERMLQDKERIIQEKERQITELLRKQEQ